MILSALLSARAPEISKGHNHGDHKGADSSQSPSKEASGHAFGSLFKGVGDLLSSNFAPWARLDFFQHAANNRPSLSIPQSLPASSQSLFKIAAATQASQPKQVDPYSTPEARKIFLERNELILRKYSQLTGKMQYKLGCEDMSPDGKADCTAATEFFADHFGNIDGVSDRWNTRTAWHTGYGMRRVGTEAVAPGDIIVVPPMHKIWDEESNCEPDGIGHAGTFVLYNEKLMISHASSRYNTFVLSTPEEFMENRLQCKIFRVPAKGVF